VTGDVIAGVLAFHARQRDRDPAAPPGVGYLPESLRILFGEGRCAPSIAASVRCGSYNRVASSRARAV
jgi:hypothetical protein